MNETVLNETKKNKDTVSLYYGREFLNMPKHGSFASIIGSVYIRKYYNEGLLTEYWPSSSLSISDCDKRINLELSVTENLENSLYKLNKIIEIATQLRDGIVEANKLIPELEKELKDANEERKSKGEQKSEVSAS